MPDKYPVRRPVNVMQTITQEFLEGAPFTEALCNKVTATYSSGTHTVSYKRELEFVKRVLANAKHSTVERDLYVINTSFEFSDLEIAMVVRLVNLCFHGERIITLNNAIIYIPKELRSYTEEEIRIHTYKTVQRVKTNWFGRWLERRAAKLARKSNKVVTIEQQLAAI